MKRRLFLLLVVVAVTLNGMAQTVGEEMYIFRNNGQINGFLPDEIESVEFSYQDAEGNEYDEIVTQIINTIDSIYKIPLAEIDSISFVTPKTEYQPDAINLSEQLMPYVIYSDSMTILFSKSTPSSILPVVGNKLVTLEMNDKFPYGFAGEVITIKEVDEGYRIECTLTNLQDIFITYFNTSSAYGYCVPDEDDNEKTRITYRSHHRANWYEDPTNWGIDRGIKFNKLSYKYGVELDRHRIQNDDIAGSLSTEYSLGITPSFHVVSTFIIRKEMGLYFMASITGEIILEEQFSYSGGIQWSHDIPFTTITAPIPNCPIVNYYIQPGIFFNAGASLSVAAKFTQTFTFGAAFEVNNRGNEAIQPIIKGQLASSTFDIEGSLDGRFAAGLYLETGLNIMCREVSRVCARGELGAEFVSHYVLRNSDIDNAKESTLAYERLKNTSFEANVFTNIFSELRAGSWGLILSPPWSSNYNLHTWSLVPTFSNVRSYKSNENPNTYDFYADVNDDLLSPVNVGFGLFDEDDNLLESKYNSEPYRVKNNWSTKILSQTFEDVKPGQNYTCSPMVRLFGMDFRATPSVEFGVDLDIQTGSVKNIEAISADTYGHIITDDLNCVSEYEYGICYTEKEGSDDWVYIPSEIDEYGNFYVFLSNLKPETDYIYCAYIKFAEDDYLYGEEMTFNTKKMVCPVKILDFKQTGSEHETNAFTNNGKTYSYKYDCAVTVELTDSKNVEDWGYIYESPEGSLTRISLMEYESPYTDTRYAYYRNEASSTVRLYEYVKFMGVREYYYGETKDYSVSHKEQDMTFCPDDNHPHAIDLGLPSGTKWACCNIGASSPEKLGSLFAWGEVDIKGVYNWDTYQYGYYDEDGDNSYLINIGTEIAGTVYDAATSNWGKAWETPSYAAYTELCDNVAYEETNLNGFNGVLLTGPNGCKIFFPSAHYQEYWTSSRDFYDIGEWYTQFANIFQPNPEMWFLSLAFGERVYKGLPIRPICNKKSTDSRGLQ